MLDPSTIRRRRSNKVGQDDHVGQPGFILDGQEHGTLGRARLLAHEHEARVISQRPSGADITSSQVTMLRAV